VENWDMFKVWVDLMTTEIYIQRYGYMGVCEGGVREVKSAKYEAKK
jgi:hypothetical protein